MLSKERLFRIMELIEEKSFVTIQELMDILNTSKSTISRDLLELEKQGLIKRERGGAIKKELPETLSNYTDIPVMNKENIHSEQKERIAQKASEQIRDGDCIYIDSGTTPTYLIPFLTNRNIKIVTPSMYFVKKLSKKFKGELFLIGGHYVPAYDMNIGFLAIEDIRKFHFDHAFFSASGIHLEQNEVMAVDFEISAVKSAALERSTHSYVLIDDSKLSVKALCTWAYLNDFECIYMNKTEKDIDLPRNFMLCE